MFGRKVKRVLEQPRRSNVTDEVVIRADVAAVWDAVTDPAVVLSVDDRSATHIAPGTGPGLGAMYVSSGPAHDGLPVVTAWQVTRWLPLHRLSFLYLSTHRRVFRAGLDLEIEAGQGEALLAGTTWMEVVAGLSAAKVDDVIVRAKPRLQADLTRMLARIKAYCEQPRTADPAAQ